MNKRKAAALLFVLLLALTVPASANGWGLRGDLLEAVSQVHTWDDYSVHGNQAGSFAVMRARYHSALFYADAAGALHVYTTAVYQPEDGMGMPALRADGNALELSYGDGERYIFRDPEGSGEYRLAWAWIDGFTVEERTGEYGYSCGRGASDADGTAVWPVRMLLANFNIRLFPRSVEEVRSMNRISAVLDDHRQCLGFAFGTGEPYSPDEPGTPVRTGRKGTAAVYSAPYGASAWRAAKGRAAVGLSGEVWHLSGCKNEDGESWACIRYDVSERTQRIGYVLCSELGLRDIGEWHPDEPLEGFACVDVEVSADTFLTDDPDVSQYPQLRVPEGTVFSCMGLYNDFYAYVSAETEDGAFTDGGYIVWGFVPVRDLRVMETERAPEAEARLVGCWKYDAGGSMGPDALAFHPDGTFTAVLWDWAADMPEDAEHAALASGTWRVHAYAPFMNLYWNDPPYQLVLEYDNGRVNVKGLSFEGEGFGLTDAEGGGGYVPAVWEEIRMTEEHG